MSSRVNNASFHPDYQNQYYEERVFEVPDRYMLRFKDYDNWRDRFNWCKMSDLSIQMREKHQWDSRKEIAFFIGSGSGKHKNHFGFGEPFPNEEE